MADTEVKSSQGGADIPQTAQLPPEMEVNLSDDKPAQTGDFAGATLELGAGGAANNEVEFKGPGLQRDRPYSASMVSRKSTTSTKSRTSMSPAITITEYSTKQLFSYKVISCSQKSIVSPYTFILIWLNRSLIDPDLRNPTQT